MKSIDVYCRPDLQFKNFSSTVLSQELRHIPKLLKARYVPENSIAPYY